MIDIWQNEEGHTIVTPRPRTYTVISIAELEDMQRELRAYQIRVDNDQIRMKELQNA